LIYRSKKQNASLMFVMFLTLSACGDQVTKKNTSLDARAALITDESGSESARLEQMDRLQRPVPQEVVEALLLMMKDRSQQAFIMAPDASPLGYETVESTYGGPDQRAEIRWTAIAALERLGERQALPDLISALYDRHEVVRHFAARALWKLGSTEGLPILLKGLEGKALENESANRVLKEISGEDFGYDTDAGWSKKTFAIEKWRGHLKTMTPDTAMLPAGQDADLDRRVRYLVAMLGQHQFLFMEQARRNLGQLGDIAVTHIASGLDDELLGKSNQQLRAYAVQALGMSKSKLADAVITGRCAVDSSAPVRSRTALAMGNLTSDSSRKVLLSMLKDSDESVVIAAIRALGARGEKAAVPVMKEHFASKTESKRGRLMAAFSLVRMGIREPQYGDHLANTMSNGETHEKAEMADLLTEWQGELFGWDERKPAERQMASLKKWREIFSR
jgi:HEAT repeat protein